MAKTILLRYGDELELELPDGQKVSILLGYEEPGKQRPELDILLPVPMAVNAFGENLVPAEVAVEGEPHVLLAKQLIVPLVTKDMTSEVGYSVREGALYHSMYPEDILGEFTPDFVPSRFLLELPPDCHRCVDEWVRKNCK